MGSRHAVDHRQMYFVPECYSSTLHYTTGDRHTTSTRAMAIIPQSLPQPLESTLPTSRHLCLLSFDSLEQWARHRIKQHPPCLYHSKANANRFISRFHYLLSWLHRLPRYGLASSILTIQVEVFNHNTFTPPVIPLFLYLQCQQSRRTVRTDTLFVILSCVTVYAPAACPCTWHYALSFTRSSRISYTSRIITTTPAFTFNNGQVTRGVMHGSVPPQHKRSVSCLPAHSDRLSNLSLFILLMPKPRH